MVAGSPGGSGLGLPRISDIQIRIRSYSDLAVFGCSRIRILTYRIRICSYQDLAVSDTGRIRIWSFSDLFVYGSGCIRILTASGSGPIEIWIWSYPDLTVLDLIQTILGRIQPVLDLIQTILDQT